MPDIPLLVSHNRKIHSQKNTLANCCDTNVVGFLKNYLSWCGLFDNMESSARDLRLTQNSVVQEEDWLGQVF